MIHILFANFFLHFAIKTFDKKIAIAPKKTHRCIKLESQQNLQISIKQTEKPKK